MGGTGNCVEGGKSRDAGRTGRQREEGGPPRASQDGEGGSKQKARLRAWSSPPPSPRRPPAAAQRPQGCQEAWVQTRCRHRTAGE